MEKTIKHFAKDCAKNYENGVEFSVRFSYGPISQIVNCPKGIPSLGKNNKRDREYFESMIMAFMEIMASYIEKNPQAKYQFKIQYIDLQGDDWEHTITTIDKSIETL